MKQRITGLTSVLILTFFFILSGCKGTKVAVGEGVDAKLSAKTIIKNHNAVFPQFKTLNGRLAIDYSDGSTSQSVTVTLRMKRNEVIWLSAPLGVIKVYITPGKVSYYNKLQNEYFEGDFSFLSEILGTELDFSKLQNILLGQALLDLKDSKYVLNYTEEAYQLKPEANPNWLKVLFEIEPNNFKLKSQQLSQPEKQRLMEVNYIGYQRVQGQLFPENLKIAASDLDGAVNVEIDYKQLELNRDLVFPYKVPKGYNPIVVK
jgi:hypothetical protein